MLRAASLFHRLSATIAASRLPCSCHPLPSTGLRNHRHRRSYCTAIPTCCQTEKDFKDAGIVPVKLPVAPRNPMQVAFCSGGCASYGNTLTPTQTLTPPRCRWQAGAFERYTLLMIDLDAPSRKEPSASQWLHWLVANVPGSQVHRGETLAEYIGSAPLIATDKHRYVLLAYKQFGVLQFDEERLCHNSQNGRANFNVTCFAQKYGLQRPVAGNYYLAEYDKSVPQIYRAMGFSG